MVQVGAHVKFAVALGDLEGEIQHHRLASGPRHLFSPTQDVDLEGY